MFNLSVFVGVLLFWVALFFLFFLISLGAFSLRMVDEKYGSGVSGEVCFFLVVLSTAILAALLTGKSAKADDSDEFWDKQCLKRELSKCGSESIPEKGKLTKHQEDVLYCRVEALVACRKDNDDV